MLLGTICAFIAAIRRKLISPQTSLLAIVAWISLSAAALSERVVYPGPPAHIYLFVIGVLSLVFAPLATVPLALAWNRTR